MAGARLEGLSGSDPAALGANRLLGRLASGGMGRIYLALAADGQLVAVKTLLAEERSATSTDAGSPAR